MEARLRPVVESLEHLVVIERLYEPRARPIVLEDSLALPKFQPPAAVELKP